MQPFIRLAVLVAGGIAASCLLLGAGGGPNCGSGMASVVCLGESIGRWQEWLGLATSIAAGLVLVLALSTLVQLRRHHRLARSLEATAVTTRLADHEVGLVPGLIAPCVAGLANSRIYCPPDLAARLDTDELRAVILHERHHQLAHAPLRLILLAAVRPALAPLPGGRRWLERRRAAVEIAADDHALDSGARRPSLARALLKLGSAVVEGGTLPSYASASELRLRHLIGEASPVGPGLGSLAPLVLPVGAFVACLAWGLIA